MALSTRTPWVFLIVASVTVTLAVWGYDRQNMMLGVGTTDLEIRFVVNDAITGRPVPGARIDIRSEGGCFREGRGGPERFALVTDREGIAARTCHDTMFVGVRSALGFTDSKNVYLPEWYCKVSAPEFAPCEAIQLATREHQRQVSRVKRGESLLIIRVSLYRAKA